MRIGKLALPPVPMPYSMAAVLITAIALSSGSEAALTPASPEVKAAVQRALEFLKANNEDHRLGGRALIAMTLLKADVSPDYPFITTTAKSVQKMVNGVSDPTTLRFTEMYSPAIMLLFLLELDPVRYRPEIEGLLEFMWSAQKPCGGWGYPSGGNAGTGDTSMTQYAVLSIWEADKKGFDVPGSTIENVLIWLLKTQDPSGGFGYQGNVSRDFTPVQQQYVFHGLTAAGMGSTYICAHLLGTYGAAEKEEEDDGLPPALRMVQDEQRQRRRINIAPDLVGTVLARGNGWFQKNYKIDPARWPHYFLYAFERYWSFRELVEVKRSNHPPWYDDGARFLLSTQNQDGSWKGNDLPSICTAFATMFLVRATRKSIGSTETLQGTLVGGRGLPKDTDSLTVRGGKVLSTRSLKSLEQLMEAIGQSDDESFEAFEMLAGAPVEEAQTLVSRHAKRLQELAKGNSGDARLAAVRALSRSRDFDHVPTLIYALSDPDPAVSREARDGLRRTSRKLEGFGMPDNPSETERKAAIEKWKRWYRSVRPDAAFED